MKARREKGKEKNNGANNFLNTIPAQGIGQERTARNGDRLMPPPQNRDCQRAKLEGLVDKPSSPLGQALCSALFGVSDKELRTRSIFSDLSNSYNKTRTTTSRVASRIPYSLKVNKSFDGTDLTSLLDINPLCWGKDSFIYVGLGDVLYTIQSATSRVTIMDAGYTYNAKITALGYHSNVLARADLNCNTLFINAETDQIIRRIDESPLYNIIQPIPGEGFYMASKGGGIVNHFDLRTFKPTHTLSFPSCSLQTIAYNKMSYTLAVSTDSAIRLYDPRATQQHSRFTFMGHKLPSKALAFSPDYGNKIVSAGKSYNRNPKVENTLIVWRPDTGDIITEANSSNYILGAHWLDRHGFFTHEAKSTDRPLPGSKDRVACWSIDKKNKLNQDSIVDESHIDPRTGHPIINGTVVYSSQHPEKKENILTGICSLNPRIVLWSAANTTMKKASVPIDESYEKESKNIIR